MLLNVGTCQDVHTFCNTSFNYYPLVLSYYLRIFISGSSGGGDFDAILITFRHIFSV